MEAEGAKQLFSRSLEKHAIRYTPYVGDGDSKSYVEVCKLQPYGPSFFIPKEDCIAHVSKRMGTALRNLLTAYKGEVYYFTLYLYVLWQYLYYAILWKSLEW